MSQAMAGFAPAGAASTTPTESAEASAGTLAATAATHHS